MSDQARALQHQVIEEAKKTRALETCTLSWEGCLDLHAGELVRPPYAFWIGERNGVWAVDVWIDQ